MIIFINIFTESSVAVDVKKFAFVRTLVNSHVLFQILVHATDVKFTIQYKVHCLI